MAIQLNHRQNRITTGSNAETAGVVLEVFNTGALILPKGVDADRVAATEVAGAFRFNTTSLTLEYYNGTVWVKIVGGFTEDLRGADGEFIVDGVTVGSAAANYVAITNALTGVGVTVEAAGSDANVDLGLAAKGTGEVTVGTGSGDVATFVGGGAADLTFTVDATDADVTTAGNLNLVGNIVNIYDNTDKVAEFRHNGGDDALLVEAVTSGILISVSGTSPSELFFGQVVNLTGNRIVEVADPIDLQDAATKAYVDAAINGLDWKNSVRAATTADITLTDLQTVDGVVLAAGDRVLVKNQTNLTQNGIYTVVDGGVWTRATDADNTPSNEVSGGMATFVTEGTTYNGTGWVLTSPVGNADLGTDNLVFAQFAGPGSLNIVGGAGISSTQNGVDWTIDADVDGVTVFASGGNGSQLAVRSSNTLGQVLRSTGNNIQEAVWGALDLSNPESVTGTLDVFQGGTGLNTVADQTILVGTGTSALAALTLGADNTFLKSEGGNLVYASAGLGDISGVDVSGAVTGNALEFNGTDWVDGQVDLGNANAVTGVVNVQNGGTGINALPQGHMVYGNGTSAMSTLTIGTSSNAGLAQVLKTNAAGDAPEWGALTLNELAGVDVSAATVADVLQFNGTDWVAAEINLVDELVKANAADTAAGYLEDKVGVDDAGALTVATSANSRVQFSVNVDSVTVGKVSNNLSVVSTAVSGQTLVSTGVSGDAAVWGAVDLENSNAVEGVLAEVNGGTGESTYAQGDVLVGDAGNGLTKLALGADKTFLRSNGTTVVYASAQLNDIDGFNVTGQVSGQALVWDGTNWVNSAINLANPNAVTGILDVAQGGTGLTAVADQGLVVGTGTSALAVLPVGTASTTSATTVLTVDTNGDVAWGGVSLNGLTDVEVTNPVDENVLQYNSALGTWVNVSISDLDRLVRVSPTDTTSGYLTEKVSAAGGLSKATLNGGANEELALSVNVDGATTFLAGDNVAVYGGATAGTVLRAIGSAGTAEWGALDLANPNAVTGILDVAQGGTGLAAVADQAILLGTGTSALATLALGAGNTFLKSNGTSVVYASAALSDLSGVDVSGATTGNALVFNGTDWVDGQVDLGNATAVTGTLGLVNGGTGLNTIAERSVLVANTADTLVALQAPNTGNQILRWNTVLATYEFVDQTSVGGFAFETITLAGNGNGFIVSADSTGDNLGLVGGQGIAVTGAGNDITIATTLSGLAVGTATSTSLVTFFNGTTMVYASADTFLADLNVPVVPAGAGFVVQTSAGVFANREIIANATGDRAGIEVLDTAASAGNVTVGLNLNALPEVTAVMDDFVVFYDASGAVNAKTSVSALLANADVSRINDSADTTYVDTDEVAGRVVIAANEGKVAEFVGASATDDFFVFNTATSAGTLRIEASGTSTDIDIRIVPKGAGEVFIGDAGNGVIQADDTFDLTVAGGDNGGDLILKGGTTGGEVLIQNDAGNALVTFGADNTVTHYAATAESYSQDYVLRFVTTGTGTDAENIAIPANGTVLLEGYIVARETTLATTANHAGYKFRAVVYNTGGAATILDAVVEEIVAESPAELQVAVTVNAADAVVTVTGATGVNMTWTGFIKVVTVVS